MSQVPPPVPPQQPYPPQSLGHAAPPVALDLRTVAVRQRVIMYCIPGYLVLVLGQFAIPPELRLIPALLALGLSVTAAVFVFMLALSLYNTGTGILLGILTL